MSLSLPRLRANSQSSKPQIHAKFKKIITETPGQIKRIINNLRSERLQSIQRFSTVEQKREVKNEKIHLNILERKLLTGRYNEEVETGQDLNQLKHKRDQYKVEIEIKKKEVQSLKLQIQSIKDQSALLQCKHQKNNQIITKLQLNYQNWQNKITSIMENKTVFQHMILNRKMLNQQSIKQGSHLQLHQERLMLEKNHLDHEQREQTDKHSLLEVNLQGLKKQLQFLQKQRIQKINNYQHQIQMRISNEASMKQKSQLYIQHLITEDRKQEENDFKTNYDRVLANKLIQKHLLQLQLKLCNQYQTLEHDYEAMSKYDTFQKNTPKSLIQRFSELLPQSQKIKTNIISEQKKIDQLKNRRNQLQKQYDSIKFRGQEQFSSLKQKKEIKNQDVTMQEEIKNNKQKNIQTKQTLIRILKQFSIKGQKNAKTGAFNNICAIQECINQHIEPNK